MALGLPSPCTRPGKSASHCLPMPTRCAPMPLRALAVRRPRCDLGDAEPHPAPCGSGAPARPEPGSHWRRGAPRCTLIHEIHPGQTRHGEHPSECIADWAAQIANGRDPQRADLRTRSLEMHTDHNCSRILGRPLSLKMCMTNYVIGSQAKNLKSPRAEEDHTHELPDVERDARPGTCCCHRSPRSRSQ